MNGIGEHIHHVYFLGIGGIGMSALARYFATKGIRISGYDKSPSDLTKELSTEGASIHFTDTPSAIPGDIDLVIYTPAIPKEHKELGMLMNSGIRIMKRSIAVGMITRGKLTVAIAGTHGKTSISSLTAHILKCSGKPVTALIGGISRNYHSNFITSGKEDIMVIEADEFDRSFLELEPDIAVISAMDPDHLDIYGSTEKMLNSFADFANRIKPNGQLISRHDLHVPIRRDIKRIGYSAEHLSDAYGDNLRISKGLQLFDILLEGVRYKDVRLKIPGRHNVENAIAAVIVSYQLGVDIEDILRSIESFNGVKRRFDFRIRETELVYIDDYAHHPKELEAFILTVKQLYPGAKLTGLFQPHLYSRTRDFAGGFAASLDLLDEPWLLDIYPARELPIPGVTSGLILKEMNNPKKELMSREVALQRLAGKKPEVFLTMGAGDIDQLVEPIEKILRA